MNLKLLLKRGALLAAANWPAVVMQFIAETMFQVLLAVPIVGAAILVAVLVGGDLAEVLQGSLREIFTASLAALASEPIALASFITAFLIVLAGGSVLMFLVKGGTIDVLLAAHEGAGDIERQPLTFEHLRPASAFTLSRFMNGSRRLFRSYLALGVALMAVYVLSGAAYLGFVVYGYRAAAGFVLMIGWTFIAALATAALVAWLTLINFIYLLMQIALATDGGRLTDACRSVAWFIRSEFRELAGLFLIIVGFVVAATLVSMLAWSGVGLIAFVPLVGLAVFPLQIAALLVRGLAFEYLGLAAAGAYITLYHRAPRAVRGERAPERARTPQRVL